jgi:hypothetical protein
VSAAPVIWTPPPKRAARVSPRGGNAALGRPGGRVSYDAPGTDVAMHGHVAARAGTVDDYA